MHFWHETKAISCYSKSSPKEASFVWFGLIYTFISIWTVVLRELTHSRRSSQRMMSSYKKLINFRRGPDSVNRSSLFRADEVVVVEIINSSRKFHHVLHPLDHPRPIPFRFFVYFTNFPVKFQINTVCQNQIVHFICFCLYA